MNERDKRQIAAMMSVHLRVLADVNLDEQNIDFADNKSVNYFLMVIHNAIVYVNAQQSLLNSLDAWEAKKRGR